MVEYNPIGTTSAVKKDVMPKTQVPGGRFFKSTSYRQYYTLTPKLKSETGDFAPLF